MWNLTRKRVTPGGSKVTRLAKIEVQLNSNEPDILLATGRDWPVEDL